MCYTLHTHREEMRGGNKVGYAVVHMMKIKSGAVGGIQSHNNREHEPKTNPDVDMSRSEDNYDLIPCDNYKRSIKEKLSNLVESSRAVRKDAVVVCNFIVTSDNETMEALGADRQREFFQDSVKWFSDRYGADRVLNAILLDLQKRISEAKSELSVVETAVKEKKAEGAEKFGWDGMAERIERARKEAGKDNRIKTLEARISLLERFISLPQVKPLWEQFQALIGRKKPQKDHER